jgi:hypothetical protein
VAQLAQTYIHLNPYEVSQKRLNALGRRAERIAIQKARTVYGGNVTVDVRLEEGSLRTWVSVAGALTIYGAIADYKGFKESVQEMCKDAREYSVDVCGAFTTAAQAKRGQVYRVERRLKTPGKINRLLKRIEQLDQVAEKMSADKLQSQLKEVQLELETIQNELSDQEKSLMQHALVFENLPMLRRRPQNRRLEAPKVVAKPEEDEPFLPVDMGPMSVPPGTKKIQPKLVYHRKVYVPAPVKASHAQHGSTIGSRGPQGA